MPFYFMTNIKPCIVFSISYCIDKADKYLLLYLHNLIINVKKIEMMKKIFLLTSVAVMCQLAFAQEQKETQIDKGSPGTEYKKHDKGGRQKRMEMMKTLNLSETQKARMKDMRMANKEKRDLILNDSKLTGDQKHEQLKKLHKANGESMQSVFTDEQKEKLKATREKMRAERKNHPGKRRHEKKGENKQKEIQTQQ
jgi:hypothetical protein